MVRKGGREVVKSDIQKIKGRKNFRVEDVSWVIFCRKLSRMMIENRLNGLLISR